MQREGLGIIGKEWNIIEGVEDGRVLENNIEILEAYIQHEGKSGQHFALRLEDPFVSLKCCRLENQTAPQNQVGKNQLVQCICKSCAILFGCVAL